MLFFFFGSFLKTGRYDMLDSKKISSDQSLRLKILFIAICFSVSASLQVFQEWFIYWRLHFYSELWRAWTAHWVHVGWIHFALNLFAFACLPFIFPNLKMRYLAILLLILPPCISLSFYYFYPHVEAYAGLSGVLHGLYVAVAIYHLKFPKERKFATLVLALTFSKIAWEHFFGSLDTADLIGSPVLVEAHWLGVVWASLISLIYFAFQKHFFRADR